MNTKRHKKKKSCNRFKKACERSSFALRVDLCGGWLCLGCVLLFGWGLGGCTAKMMSSKSSPSMGPRDELLRRTLEDEVPSESKKADEEVERLYHWLQRKSGKRKKVRVEREFMGGVGSKDDDTRRKMSPGIPTKTPRAVQNREPMRMETVQTSKKPWWAPAPPPRRVTAYRQLSPKERICRSAHMICRVSERICRIAERYRENMKFQKICGRSKKDCLAAQKRCKAM